MPRTITTPQRWEPTESGWRWGRYEVRGDGPGRWDLAAGGRTISTHPRASDAATEASLVDRARRKRIAVLRNAATVVASLLVLVLAYEMRTVTNEANAPARDFVAELEAAYRSVEFGGRDVEEYDGADGITGGSFITAVPLDLGDVKLEPRPYEALVAVHAGECYVVRWTPGGAVLTGVLAPDLPCEPDPRLIQSALFVRAASQPPDSVEFRWDEVIPPPDYQARWFVPVLLLVVFLVAQGVVGLTLALIRPVRRRIPPLAIDVRARRTPLPVDRS
jgi:hypothetical protein